MSHLSKLSAMPPVGLVVIAESPSSWPLPRVEFLTLASGKHQFFNAQLSSQSNSHIHI